MIWNNKCSCLQTLCLLLIMCLIHYIIAWFIAIMFPPQRSTGICASNNVKLVEDYSQLEKKSNNWASEVALIGSQAAFSKSVRPMLLALSSSSVPSVWHYLLSSSSCWTSILGECSSFTARPAQDAMNPRSSHGSPPPLVCGSIPIQRLAMELDRSFAQVWDRACPGCSRGRIKPSLRGLAMAAKPSRSTNPSLSRKEERSEG